MRTLDEEIAHQREVAEKIRTEHNCECDYYDIDIDCVKCAEEHEQLAEWLEELKDYRDKNKMVVRVNVENIESVKEKIRKLSKEQYNNGIDDFAKSIIDMVNDFSTVEDEYGLLRPMTIEEMCDKIAEQLKAGESE